MLEVPAYALSQYLVYDVTKGIDAGGSITIHAFGAYYGLAASCFFSFKSSGRANPKNGASYTSDVFAMLASMCAASVNCKHPSTCQNTLPGCTLYMGGAQLMQACDSSHAAS